MKDVLVAVLLAAGVAVELFSCVALALFRTPLQRIHALGAGNVTGAILVLGAVAVARGFSAAGLKALTILLLVLGGGAIVAHATARAAYVRLERTPDREGA